jgi:plastocyanin
LRLTHITLDTSISSVKIMSGARCLCPSGHVQHHDEEGGTMKKFVALGALVSGMIVLLFASIATAQSTPDQYSNPDQYSTDQVQSSTTGSQEGPTRGQATPTQNTPTVSIGANGFDPSQIEVAAGTPVTFVNDDTMPHTVSLDGLFDSPEIPAGYSYPVTLDGTGTVTYHDKANPEMQGTIIVGEAAGGESTVPASTTPQETTPPQETTTSQVTTQQYSMGNY